MLRWLTHNGFLHLDSRGGGGGGAGGSSTSIDSTGDGGGDDTGDGGDDEEGDEDEGEDADGEDAEGDQPGELNDAEKAFLQKAGMKGDEKDPDKWQALWRATFEDRGRLTAENNKLRKDARDATKKASSAESRYADLDLKELLGSETPTKEQLQEVAKRAKIGDSISKRAERLHKAGLIPEPVLDLLTTDETDPVALGVMMDDAKKAMRKDSRNGRNGSGSDDDPVTALFKKHGLRKKGTPRGGNPPGDPEKRAKELLGRARGQGSPPEADPSDYYAKVAEKNKQTAPQR